MKKSEGIFLAVVLLITITALAVSYNNRVTDLELQVQDIQINQSMQVIDTTDEWTAARHDTITVRRTAPEDTIWLHVIELPLAFDLDMNETEQAYWYGRIDSWIDNVKIIINWHLISSSMIGEQKPDTLAAFYKKKAEAWRRECAKRVYPHEIGDVK